MTALSSVPLETNPAERRRLWMVTLPAMVFPGLATLAYFVMFRESKIAQPLYALTKIAEIIWPFVATLWILGRPLGLRARPLRWHLSAVPLGLAYGLGIAAIMAVWMYSPFAPLVEQGAPGVNAKVDALGFREQFILFAIFISIVHSFLEEFYWRWFVYGNLRQLLPGQRAHVLAAVAFAAHHLVVTSQFFPLSLAAFFAACVGIGGYLWSRLYEHQQSLAGAWASHLVVDAGLMVIGWHLLRL